MGFALGTIYHVAHACVIARPCLIVGNLFSVVYAPNHLLKLGALLQKYCQRMQYIFYFIFYAIEIMFWV